MMHIESMKDVTKDKKIIPLKDPDLFLIPLFEKFGSKPEAVVKPGDRVRKYEVLGRAEKGFSAPVHAPVSGIIEKIEKITHTDGVSAPTIFLRNDYMNEEVERPLGEINPDSPSELLKVIENAGVVGMGGAQFPTSKKYNRKEKIVKTFIVNGAECEPFLTSDYILMKDYTKELLEGILLIDKILDAQDIVIAFERSNKDLEEAFRNYSDTRYKKIRTQIVPDEYPQGGELQLTKTITGIEIAKGMVPLDKGVIVSNIETIYAVYQAVIHGKPLIERLITVSGEGIRMPGNYRVKIGTPISHVIRSCEIDTENMHVISGGPMMSPHIRDFSQPLHKGSLGIVALPKEKIDRLPCIWCGLCVDVCPMYLMPMKYEQFYRRGIYRKLDDYNLNDCIECGSCEYICPSNVPLIESIKEGKVKLKEIKDASDKKTA